MEEVCEKSSKEVCFFGRKNGVRKRERRTGRQNENGEEEDSRMERRGVRMGEKTKIEKEGIKVGKITEKGKQSLEYVLSSAVM